MLRISFSAELPPGTVRLEGKLLEPWIGEVRVAVARASARGRVRLDLAGLTFADQAAVAFLHQLIAGGVLVEGATPFVSELLANHVPRDR